MKEQLKIFLTAVMFYTRIPCPNWVDHSADYINKCTRFFPLIGWIVGVFFGLVFMASNYFFSIEISLILTMIAGILLTGAFHEDGFADVCDGFGGGWTKEKILTIMKDSTIGVYGAIGLIAILALKFAAILQITQLNTNLIELILVFVSAHSLSRFMSVIIIYTDSYVREDELSKAKPIAKQMAKADFFIALIFGLIPYLFLIFFNIKQNILNIHYYSFVVLPLVLIFAIWRLKKYFKKWIGGYTGDCLGASQQISEVLFYLILTLKWKFI